MISDCISEDIPPQMKILNMVIPILIQFCSLVSNWSIASCTVACHPTKCDVITEVKLYQASHRLEKYLNLEDFLVKSLKIKYSLKSTGK